MSLFLFSSFSRYGMESVGDASSWNVMLERFVRENNAQEKKKILYGLGEG